MKGDDTIPRNKYPEETRKKILEAAVSVFQEKGYDECTVLDIVANMQGLTRGAFYHHFKSKEEVLNTISETIFTENDPFSKFMHRKDLNGLQKLRTALKFNIETNIDERHKYLLKASISLLKSPKYLQEQLLYNKKISRESILPIIEEGVADGSLTVSHPLLVAELLVILFNFWLLPVIYDGDEHYIEQKAELNLKILESLGLPLFGDDDELEELGATFVDVLHSIDNVHEK